MRNFVVSLADSNEARRNHVSKEFESKNVTFEFFDAVTPQDNMELLQRYNLENITGKLYPVEISCFLSHYMIWQKVVEEGLSSVGVFEDDIYLGDDAHLFLTNMDWIDSDTHIIKLEKGTQKTVKISFRPEKRLYGRKIHALKSAHFGTAGYILTRVGAEFLIEQCQVAIEMRPVDVFIFRILLDNKNYNVKQMSPALCIQDFLVNQNDHNFQSSIELARVHKMDRKDKIKKSLYSKLLRECKRLALQVKRLISERTIQFK